MNFVPLHVHSQYSILDASAPIDSIVNQAISFGMPAVALTDHGNLFGAVDFFKACKGGGIKPIIGCELYVAPGSRFEKKKEGRERTSYHLTLLAKNIEGYHNLCKLSSAGFLEGFYYFPRVDKELLKECSQGLVCLSGCLSSSLSHQILNGFEETISQEVDWFQEVFGDDYYFEVQRHQMSEEHLQQDGFYQETWLLQNYQDFISRQTKVNEALTRLSKERNIPLVATNDSHYIFREDWRAHEVLLNVQSGEPCEIWQKDSLGNRTFQIPNPKRKVYASHELFFKSPEEMGALFEDLPSALSNTLEVANKCEVELDFKAKHYPVFVPPDLRDKDYTSADREKGVESYLRELCEKGIKERYTPSRLAKIKEIYPDRDPLEVVKGRLEREMGVIVPKEMCDYLLIVWDFIHWAKNQGIPVGPGRGSGAGSIVLYLIGVTDIEPLRFNLFFERFINPERLSYPDIDVDICMDRRQEVIQYTLETYGKDNVAQIITFGTMKAKSVIRDVGRVLSIPLTKVNQIAKLVPEDLNITLEKALAKDPDLHKTYTEDEEAKRIIDLGLKLEGSIRNTGIHAAGLIVSGLPLIHHIPVCTAKDSEMPVTQFSMKPVEQVGMLKIDFLGLKTLTAIQSCVDEIASKGGEKINWTDLDLEDKATFDLLNQGKTLGVFQLESGGMQDLARQLHLDKFEEIIAVGALYRPGPMDMIPSFIQRKHGKEPIEYDHPWMKDILSETYGIMVYQEQVMQIAQNLAKYSLGEGDVLRRAMGKKDHEQMKKEREKFRSGALEMGIDEGISMQIFDKMEKFASYGFNKSHAAAYGYLSYVTAYLKANYPNEWMAALMTCDSHDLTKVAKFIREAKSQGIAMLPPNINESKTTFVATSSGIRFALSGIKGVGTGVVEAIIEEREKGGEFTGLYHFFQRVDPKKVGKKVVESLVLAGAFDFTGWTRDQLILSIDPMFDSAVSERKDEAEGVMSLFSLIGETPEKQFEKPPEVKIPAERNALLLKERELLGFFLTGHPMDEYKKILDRLSCVSLSRVESMDHETVFRSAVIVESMQVRFSSKTQKKFAILMVGDGMVGYELPIWPEMYEQKNHLLLENQLLYAVIQVDRSGEGIRLSCRWIEDLTKADEKMIQECDQAFDRAMHMIHRRKKFPPKKQQEEKKEESKMEITLDADQARLSHILEIKAVFQAHRGPVPVEVVFRSGEAKLGTLLVDPRWGISDPDEVKKKLEAIGSVL